MTLDTIISTLRTSELPPAAALREAVAHAEHLAPRVYDLAGRFCRGICLRPDDENLLLYGLHVLAAARHDGLWPHLVALARAPEDEVEGLFLHHASTSMTALMVSVWDGDIDGLLRLIEHADLCDSGKFALFDVLSVSAFDGRVPRDTARDFLERFEAENLGDDDSIAWMGWEGAVTKLGLVDLEPALRRAWSKPAFAEYRDADRADAMEELAAAAASPADPRNFIAECLVPVSDPADALDWMHRQHEMAIEMGWIASPATSGTNDGDPAREIRLSDEDALWLSRFLTSRQVPPTTMPLDMLDGYLTALAIGPETIPPEEYVQAIWGEDKSASPDWEDEAQAAQVLELIGRWARAISVRRAAKALHHPQISMSPFDELPRGSAWSEGFAAGIDQFEAAWAPLFDDRNGAEDVLAAIALCENETEYFGRPATTKERVQIIERLPVILQRIAAFWDEPAKGYPRPQPVKVDKIGRNDPCPCGSGKKYKKCCGQ